MSAINKNFSSGAAKYDNVAYIQPLVAARLAAKIDGGPRRILEIGCGTGALSLHLAKIFPDAELILTDISLPMLEICKAKLNGRGKFIIMDGERPDTTIGQFDLITSSLAMQWFKDLPRSLCQLKDLLRPGGKFVFATLGKDSFKEWRMLLKKYNLSSGLHHYPDLLTFPWPSGSTSRMEEEFLTENHSSGTAFLKTLKAIGAATPRSGYKPLPTGALKTALLDTRGGFIVTYHILYGFIEA
ncbi:methyltransferase domain-containing protein [Acidocella sp.]|uniref:methyltransferase domain-containing protein n=1 Tax=Acidocella sp. TaxID=50710 RepID=UPI002638524B|nr:methyltransferase domain-containing protein [Acidocella sp.]